MDNSVYYHRRIAKLYVGLGIIVSGIFLLVSLLSPSEIQRSLIFGYSIQRLALASLFLISAIVFCVAYFLIRSGRLDRRLDYFARGDLFWIPLSNSVLFIVGLVLACFYYFQSGGFLTNYLERLLPFSWWLMILLFFLVYFASARYNLGVYFSSLLIFIIFAGFNSVYFPSNFIWAIPFIPLSLLEFLQSRPISTEVTKIVNI